MRAPLLETALEAASRAPAVSVDLSSTAAIEEAGVDRFRRTLESLRPDIVFANEAEARLVGELDAETVVVKLGARGCVVHGPAGRVELPALEAEAVDSTGAGDAFAAGFLVGGPELALDAAARCVAKMGAMP